MISADAFIMAIPGDPYAECPCGCGKKWRFVAKDLDNLWSHEDRFNAALKAAYKARPAAELSLVEG